MDEHVEREVARRLARVNQEHNEEVADLRSIIKDCQDDLIRQNQIISTLSSQPLNFGTIVKIHNFVDPTNFKGEDEVVVVDKTSPYYQNGGSILGKPTEVAVDDEGYVNVLLTDGTCERFAVGVEGKATAQVRLTKKTDGTFAVVNVDGKPWEVRGVPDADMRIGSTVKVLPDTKAIISLAPSLDSGPICTVVALVDNCIEVLYKGDKQLVYNPHAIPLEEGDRVCCDTNMFCIQRKLPQDSRKKYKIASELNTSWDDIGGLEGPKQDLKDALELPFQKPELFAYYGKQPLNGVLLYGPPGNGKTLLARVAAWSMAKIHGKSATDSAYIYVKSPEILDKWVGNTEKEIKELFEMGRRHYRQHGYKAVLVFDEADAIMPQRGSRISSSISDTLVPMFLGEMDGVDIEKTKENPIIFLLTNRQDALDPAITRPGRISLHIKIERPNENSAIDVLDIHSKNVPFKDPKNRLAILAITSSDLFSKTRVLFRINNEHDFTLGDCVSGAMLANVIEIAKMNALHRDELSNTMTGVIIDDFRDAVSKIYKQQSGQNSSYDLMDFCERHGIRHESAKIERCFGAA